VSTVNFVNIYIYTYIHISVLQMKIKKQGFFVLTYQPVSKQLFPPSKKPTFGGFKLRFVVVEVESWMGGYEAIWADIAKMENAPVVLTSMGYVGNLEMKEKFPCP